MNGINLDVIQLSLASPMDESDWAAGYGVDLLFGPDASAYSVGSAGEADDVAVRQAYVNTRVPVGNGLDLKLGVFDAIIGYEGFSNRDNPNYSRNMAYNLQPFNHTGVLAGYQVNDLVGVQFGVANTGSNIVTTAPQIPVMFPTWDLSPSKLQTALVLSLVPPFTLVL